MNTGEPALLVRDPEDSLVLSPASSLVNNVNNDGLELLVPDRTIRVQRSLF